MDNFYRPAFVDTAPQTWKWMSLAEACQGVFDCPHSTPELTVDGPLLARSQDIRSGMFRTESAGHVSRETYDERVRRAIPRHGDLLYSREGTYFGIAAEVPPDLEVCLGQRMVLLRPKPDELQFRFLRCWLNSPVMASYIHGFRDGTVAERLNLTTIRKLPIPIPPLAEQRAIAHILGSLDDKIELNRQMNRTLEEMARAIFKSWFVDFDPVHAKARGEQPVGMDAATSALFPATFDDTELGPVPSGWSMVKIRNCCIRIENGGTPKRSEPQYWSPPTIPWLTSGEVRQGIVTVTENHISKLGFANSSAKLWPSGTTVVALYGATAGQAAYLGIPTSANQACCALIPLESHDYFVYLHIVNAYSFLVTQTRGSAQQNLSQAIVADVPVTVPPTEVLARFHNLVSPMFDLMLSNLAACRTLAELRDTLLPKLMSGELRVPEAAEMADHSLVNDTFDATMLMNLGVMQS